MIDYTKRPRIDYTKHTTTSNETESTPMLTRLLNIIRPTKPEQFADLLAPYGATYYKVS